MKRLLFQLAEPARGALSSASATACLLLLVLLQLAAVPARAQISPGPLAKSHESLSGTSGCASCHQFGANTPTFKCLECHKEIARLLSEQKGYHARLEMKNLNGKDCVRCHLDHNGANFPLIHWEPSLQEFDHRLTGYPLEGKHAGVVCEKCHTPAHMERDIRALLKRQDPAKSYLGTSTQCIACHEDYHKGQLGPDCQSCHNLTDWKAAKQFDHSKTRYPLTGLHIQVACEKCHKPDAPGAPARFKDMKFANCSDCHVDPHRGSFKQRCEECHTTASWKRVLPGFAFDHSKTKFPLLGGHAKVACDACHTSGDFKKNIPFANCAACHKDVHKGQFADRPKKGECAECHNVDAWKPSLFGVKEHQTSRYPLEGKHVIVECAKCHTPAGADTLYKVKFAACLDCHKDVHEGQFSAAPYKDRCEACHTVKDFHRSLYTVAMHQKSSYPLTGAHTSVPCNDCHKPEMTHRSDKILPFRFADQTCTACHADPHHGEFRDRMVRRRPNGTPFGCEACHSTKSWIDVNGFDHAKTSFPLLGAHRTVPCGQCHKAPPGQTAILFKGTPTECEACHADVHGSQFKNRANKTPCADCHNAQRWVPSIFDHDKRTPFPLTGGHANVACAKCHTTNKLIAGNSVVFYKPTPKKCDECHGNMPTSGFRLLQGLVDPQQSYSRKL